MTERKATKPPAERRRHPIGFDPRRERRQLAADERAAVRSTRTPEQQIALLDARGERAASERDSLWWVMQK